MTEPTQRYTRTESDLPGEICPACGANTEVATAEAYVGQVDMQWMLAKAITAAGSARAFAQRYGLSEQYVSDLRHGKRPFTNTVAAFFGLQIEERFVPLPKPLKGADA